VEQHVPPPQEPLPGPHVLTHVPPLQVGVPFAQLAHIAPVYPHAPLAVPGVHIPLSGSQHPPLHCCVGLQDSVHLFVDVSQAYPGGQSVGCVQPHAELTHAKPAGLLAQVPQLGPQLVGPSATHELPKQHVPPPHGPSVG
jgi:hypothetical protein